MPQGKHFTKVLTEVHLDKKGNPLKLSLELKMKVQKIILVS